MLKKQNAESIISLSAMNLFQQGIEYMKADKFSEALICFDRVYKTDGQIPNLHYACAVAFLKLGQNRDALLACQSEIAKDPDHRDAIALLNGIISQEELCWPESVYLINHEHHFVYCPIGRVLSTNMPRAILKVAGLHEKHGHGEKRVTCKVYGTIYNCVKKECSFKTKVGNMGTALQILNDDRYFKFTIVRNPWSRLLSGYLHKLITAPNYWYKVHDERIRQIRNENNLSPDVGKSVTFRQFAEYVVRKSDMETYDHWRSQVCFLAGHKFDFIAKFENMRHDLNYINNKLGLNFDIDLDESPISYMKNEAHQDKYFCDCYADELKIINKNCGGFPTYKQFYPPELKELVARRYAGDIETFGYEF